MTNIMQLLFPCKGRLSRAEFGKCLLWFMLAFFVVTYTTVGAFADIVLSRFPPVSFMIGLRAALFPTGFLMLSVIWCVLAIKRAHDLGKPAAWLFLSWNTLGLLFFEGEQGPNRVWPRRVFNVIG